MEKKKKKVAKHVVGPIMRLICEWQLKTIKESYLSRAPEINGIIFSNEGSKGREPLFDASKNKTGDAMVYWEDESKGWICISAPEPGYEIRAPKSMKEFFYGTVFFDDGVAGKSITYLDVSHLDVSNTTDFEGCFWGFGQHGESKIKGLETWDVSHGTKFFGMFERAFSNNEIVSLDLSSWCFQMTKEINMASMFRDFAGWSKDVTLNLKDWQVFTVGNFESMFDGFASEAKRVKISGVEEWPVGHGYNFNRMFRDFAPQSNCRLNLSNWNKTGKLVGSHEEFSDGTFFKIREPEWTFKEVGRRRNK